MLLSWKLLLLNFWGVLIVSTLFATFILVLLFLYNLL